MKFDRIHLPSISGFRRLSGWAGLYIVGLSIVSGLVTYAILTGLTPIPPTRNVVIWLLILNAVLVASMAGMVLWQLWQLYSARRQGEAGAGLHLRLVSLFSLIAALPALIVAAFATVTLNRGLDTWFSDRTRTIVNSSVSVAEAYIRDHGEATRGDVAAIAADLNQQLPLYEKDPRAFVQRVGRQALIRGLAGAFVFDYQNKRLDVNVTANNSIQFRAPAADLVQKADKGELVLLPPQQGSNLVRALIKLTAFPSHYLYVYRVVNPKVIDQLAQTKTLKGEYDELLEQRAGVQVTFAIMYTGLAFVFLMSAIWLGMWMADRLVQPVTRVLVAARRVSEGDLDAKVDVVEGPGDLKTLGRTFNRMTDDLKDQRNALISTNNQLDERRRFMEAMLRGISAGVIGLEPDGRISLVNRSALSLLATNEGELLNSVLDGTLPQFAALLEQAKARPSGSAEAQIDMRAGGRDRSFFVRVTTEASDEADHGYVVTFDDITELVAAQRNSAWADIARRIAHEIKNPLTPIQLSAERLKRKYGREIQSDKQVFEQCTDTIIRQVGDIGRMVDEFSAFARMPKAVLEANDLSSIVREATVLQRVSSSDYVIDVAVPDSPVVFDFDRRLVTQAVTNLVKNAREAIETRQQRQIDPQGHILVEAGIEAGAPFIRVTDNGVGLPKENRHRLTEPYMTTREKGTGLGLAIVKRIMEEHEGGLTLADAPGDFAGGLGACVELRFKAHVLKPLALTA